MNRLDALVPVALVFVFAWLSAQGARSAPEFELADLAGNKHSLAAQRGRIVVLEWTSDRCPNVQRAHDDGTIAAAKTAVRGDDVVWWCIDSSRDGSTRKADIEKWRTARGIAQPWLLDTDGAAGAAFGARVTPHVFVIDASGNLAFSGGLGTEKSNPVVDAVSALRKGQQPWPGVHEPAGTVIPFARECGAAEFEAAAAHTRDGKLAEALRSFDAAATNGYRRLNDVQHLPSFAALRRDFDARARLRTVLERNARESIAVMVDADEGGVPLLVTGVVRTADGKPAPNAFVYAYHTDAKGLYAERRNDNGNRRIFAFLRTAADGSFELRTIRPASYPGGEVPQHIHLLVKPDGGAQKEFELEFADDPIHRGKPPSWAGKVTRGTNGVDHCIRDLVLPK